MIYCRNPFLIKVNIVLCDFDKVEWHMSQSFFNQGKLTEKGSYVLRKRESQSFFNQGKLIKREDLLYPYDVCRNPFLIKVNLPKP